MENNIIKSLIVKAKESHNLSFEEIVALLLDENCETELFNAADEVRKKYVGDAIHLRGLIEFSNFCKQNCHYCGLRRDNKVIERYRLNENEIILAAKQAVNLGYKTIVLQSAEDNFYNVERLTYIISEIKKLNVAVTLSIGEKTFEEYKAYKEAGCDRYLLRIETTNQKIYEQYDPGMSFENRINCLKNLKKLNYEVGTGSLIGLPNQTVYDLASDILFFLELDADMIGIGPFIPNPNTPLGNFNPPNFNLVLKMVSIIRLLMPDINIPATTAMETLHPNGRILALNCGANVIMPNATDINFRKKYLLYPNKFGILESPVESLEKVKMQIKSINRYVASDLGYRKKKYALI